MFNYKCIQWKPTYFKLALHPLLILLPVLLLYLLVVLNGLDEFCLDQCGLLIAMVGTEVTK
jgi:hypothetical protein